MDCENMNIPFKQYKREYERVFSDENGIRKKCNLEKISLYKNIPKSNALYIKQLRELNRDFEKTSFDHMVKMRWLVRRFCYNGRQREAAEKNGFSTDATYGIFMRNYVGYDPKYYYSLRSPFSHMHTYFDDFFPDFDDGNPFEEKYEYPYKFISAQCLTVVYQMPERLELLRYADSQEMNIAQFLDYIVNYISCYNYDHGDTYVFVKDYTCFPYVKNLKSNYLKKYKNINKKKICKMKNQ